MRSSKGDKEEKRSVPRRLFSFDNIKAATSKRTASEGSDADQESVQHGRATSRLSNLTEVREGQGDRYENVFGGPTVVSPTPDPFASRSDSPATDPFAAPTRSETGHSNSPFDARSNTPDSFRSASPSRRWDQLRQHVVPPKRPSTPSTHASRPSVSSVGSSRPSTPKSRLARLGFRHVVDHAREVHDTRKLGDEISRMCYAIRYPEASKGKQDKDAQSTIGGGSSLYLPFMSGTSLMMSGSSAIHSTGASKKSDAKRPQSSQSVLTASKSTASLKALYQLLVYQSAPPSDLVVLSAYLPRENQVLSTLLAPFQVASKTTRWEEERVIAVDTFELLSKGWAPEDEAGAVHRCVWCCKAAMISSSPTRTRVLANLWRTLVPGDRDRGAITVQAFQTIVHHLFMLLSFLHSPQSGHLLENEVQLVKDVILQFLSGSYGDINESEVEEEYGVVWLPEDSRVVLRKVIFLDALANCLQNCAQSTSVWLLLTVVEDYWPSSTQDPNYTPLQMVVHSHKISAFCTAVYALLQSSVMESGERLAVAQQTVTLLQNCVIPETGFLDLTIALEARGHVVKVVLEMLCMDNAREVVRWALTTIGGWLHDADRQWKSNLEKHLQRTISDSTWPTVLRLFSCLLQQLPDQDRKIVVVIALPLLNDRLVNDPPSYPNLDLANLLNSLSRLYPPIFFKPLFLCAASSREFTVINHLSTLAVYSKFVDDLWARDAEMMSIALMSDAGAPRESLSWTSENVPWSVARLGQSVLMVELIARLQALRRAKEASSLSESSYVSIVKFVVALESRLSILLEAKERTAMIAPSQRMLICMLFREFRLLNRSLKPAPWLQRTISWFAEFFLEDDFAGDLEQEVTEAMERIQGLFLAALDASRQNQKRRSTLLLSAAHRSPDSPEPSGILDLGALFEERKPLIDGLLKGFPSKALKLLVSVSSLLSDEDYRRIAPILWQRGLLDHADAPATPSACFLLMQCAEKTPMDTLALIEVDLRSSDDRTRLEAVRKIGILINWRLQVMNQNFLADRAHRPFKMARIPLPFVATDMGTSLYTPVEEVNESQDKSEIPVELRKQLAELGWVEENAGPIDPRREWIKTPMSLLPVAQLDKMDLSVGSNVEPIAASPMPSPQPSPTRRAHRSAKEISEDAALLRRSSTSGGPQAIQKRRAIFVPPLTPIFIRLSRLIYDPNFFIACATRGILLDLMKNDPSLLTRPVLDLFAGDQKDIATAATTFSSFLHVHQALPPPMSYNIFNNIMGFLKYAARQLDVPETLHESALSLSVLARVVTQVSGMDFREIRRSKTDVFVVPSGALWFPQSAPKGPMFPRGTQDFANPFEDITAKVISLTTVRISQNMFYLLMLKRNPQDVTMIRKGMSRLVLPSLSPDTVEPRAVGLKDMLPGKHERIQPDDTIETMSLVLSRSYLMLLAQVFRSMSRHLSDRNELAILIDGINRILCIHGHDIGIVGHALIALMVATTRFRRLFTTGTAYTLVMPVLVKVYTESEQHPGIRPAIEYAINRFYALHKDSFLYQSLGIIGQMAMLPQLDESAFSKSVYNLFFSLTKGITSSTVDAAGIHNVNKGQEREALIVNTAEDKPQTFLASLKRTDFQDSSQIAFLFPDEYEADRLRMDNFVRLFLTVIAHDLSIMRAQHYLRLLRMLAPHLYNSSGSARAVLDEGISALGVILIKGFNKSKGADSSGTRSAEDTTVLPAIATMENHSSEQSRVQSDLKVIRIDYLQLLLTFGQAGADISLKVARQAIELVKLILKDSTNEMNKILSSFLSDFVKMLLIREHAPIPKAVVIFLQDLAPLFHAHMASVNFSGVLETIHQITLFPLYANEREFSRVVIGEICTAGLAACELALSENYLLVLPYRPTLIKLIAECVFLQGGDIIAEIEKRDPSYQFLAGVVFPIVLALKTEGQINSDGLRTQDRHRSVLASAWLRLLFYAISACQKSRREGRQKSKSRDKNSRVEAAYLRVQLPVFLIALQIIKVIVIRAEADISSLPGIWERIAAFLKSMLADGNTEFATRAEIPSTFNSPTASPRASGYFDLSGSSFSQFSAAFAQASVRDRLFSRPRVIDYMLWSMLGFLWAYRSPLRLQLRLLTTEKVLALDNDLRRAQLSSPYLPSPQHRMSSVFSKVRSRSSGLAPSPDASPRMTPARSSALLEPTPAFLDVRRPGYQISPVSPSEQRPFGAPQIVHLGPTSPSALQGPPSPGLPGGKGMRSMVRSTKIKSLKLVEATYHRIRDVQAFMGYDLLLPLPGRDEDVVLKTWTKSQALAEISQETKDLLEEFEQAFVDLGDSEDANIGIEIDDTMLSAPPS